ncbi:hypothetical protein V6N11_035411 [Hibiscus sabdariffa]|uniref:Uncharacterized protein n=1 Tax=Hibiscus sabdariffa TaxID=183260 RepID=A0ABR2R0B8_9ROSI
MKQSCSPTRPLQYESFLYLGQVLLKEYVVDPYTVNNPVTLAMPVEPSYLQVCSLQDRRTGNELPIGTVAFPVRSATPKIPIVVDYPLL